MSIRIPGSMTAVCPVIDDRCAVSTGEAARWHSVYYNFSRTHVQRDLRIMPFAAGDRLSLCLRSVGSNDGITV